MQNRKWSITLNILTCKSICHDLRNFPEFILLSTKVPKFNSHLSIYTIDIGLIIDANTFKLGLADTQVRRSR